RDPKVRDALILHYSPWARAVARDVYMRVYLMRDAWHDCAQNALLGLIEAIERFDPGRGVPFQPYARHRVRGAVFDGVRALRTGTMLADSHAHDVRVRERVESLQEDGSADPLETFVATTVGLVGFPAGYTVHARPGPARRSLCRAGKSRIERGRGRRDGATPGARASDSSVALPPSGSLRGHRRADVLDQGAHFPAPQARPGTASCRIARAHLVGMLSADWRGAMTTTQSISAVRVDDEWRRWIAESPKFIAHV